MELFLKDRSTDWLQTLERSLGTNYAEQNQNWSSKTSKNPEWDWLCLQKEAFARYPCNLGYVYYNMIFFFFFKRDQMDPLFQIFLIFQLLSEGVTNLLSCSQSLVVTRRRVIICLIATDSHTWWENGFFQEKNVKLLFLNILKFSLFSYFRFKCLFLSKFLTIVDGIGLKCLLMAHTTLPWQ